MTQKQAVEDEEPTLKGITMKVFVRKVGTGIIATKDNGAFVCGKDDDAKAILDSLGLEEVPEEGIEVEETEECNFLLLVNDADYCLKPE